MDLVAWGQWTWWHGDDGGGGMGMMDLVAGG